MVGTGQADAGRPCGSSCNSVWRHNRAEVKEKEEFKKERVVNEIACKKRLRKFRPEERSLHF